jgi:hypothetical protein
MRKLVLRVLKSLEGEGKVKRNTQRRSTRWQTTENSVNRRANELVA